MTTCATSAVNINEKESINRQAPVSQLPQMIRFEIVTCWLYLTSSQQRQNVCITIFPVAHGQLRPMFSYNCIYTELIDCSLVSLCNDF